MSHTSRNESSGEEYYSADEEERMASSQEAERPLRTQLAGISVSEPGCTDREGLEKGSEDDAGVRTETESECVAGLSAESREQGHSAEDGSGTGTGLDEEQAEDGSGTGTGLDEERGAGQAGAESTNGNEYVTGLDNRYVSEDVVVKGEEVELTEEQVKVRRRS